jgi:hypothetical protein
LVGGGGGCEWRFRVASQGCEVEDGRAGKVRRVNRAVRTKRAMRRLWGQGGALGGERASPLPRAAPVLLVLPAPHHRGLAAPRVSAMEGVRRGPTTTKSRVKR